MKPIFKGFALISALVVLALLSLVAVAFLSLSTVGIKNTRIDFHQREAESNARLALMIALGELQRELGPDQRVSARSDLSIEEGEKYWTASYRTTQSNGKPWISRSQERGLVDQRNGGQGDTDDSLVNYLVSGNEGSRGGRLVYYPDKFERVDGIRMVGEGSAGRDESRHVFVPKIGIEKEGQLTGGYAFWVGDAGVRANVGVGEGDSTDEVSRVIDLLGMAGAESAAMEMGGDRLTIRGSSQRLLVSDLTVGLMGEGAQDWVREKFHDFTTQSRGVFANVRDGKLQKNLTVFLNQNEDIAPLNVGGTRLPGLAGSDNLVGFANQQRADEEGVDWNSQKHRRSSPRFEMLRALLRDAEEIALKSGAVESKLPKRQQGFRLPGVLEGSSQNLSPAALAEVEATTLAPVLVEGSMFNTFSVHNNPPGSRFRYNIRSHDFPRVVLWNPYSVPLVFPDSVIVLQINGRRGFRTDAWIRTDDGQERLVGWASWLNFGGRTQPDGPVIGSEAYDDKYTGSYYFKLEGINFEPGECLVFLPTQAAEYDGQNVLNNTLSATADYNFANNYYHSASEFDEENPEDIGGMNWYPKRFWYQPSDRHFQAATGDASAKQETQGDDSQMVLKKLGTSNSLTPQEFDLLDQVAAVSCSLQYGAGREPPEAWYHDPNDPNSGVEIEFLELVDPVVTVPPDRRTRQGYRMRWFREHPSNVGMGGNALSGFPEVWDESPLANWNPRAAYASRSPYENLIGNQGDGTVSGPWFFGIYTRDLYDEAIGWDLQTPIRGTGGRNRGFPFGLPLEGPEKMVVFDVPRKEVGLVSLAQLRHVKLTDYVWHPSFPIGNSLVDPRFGLDGMTGTKPGEDGQAFRFNGFSGDLIGWSNNAERGVGQDSWASHGRGFFHDLPEEEDLVYDLSYEVNFNLWDDYFLSSGSQTELQKFAVREPGVRLPNHRIVRISSGDPDDGVDFHRSPLIYMNEGAFNVNSTSVEAWKAVLSSNRREDGATPFPRTIDGSGKEWSSDDGFSLDQLWGGVRVLNDYEIDSLARAIVEEVKKRGPFLSLSDFVNRRLAPGELGKKGALEAAIEASGVNSIFDEFEDYKVRRDRSLGDYQHPDNIDDATRLEQTMKPVSKVWGASTYVTQGDVLQAIGAGLSARSDTFVVRAYGESVVRGEVVARAWCEATIQRLPEPVTPDESGINPLIDEDLPDFGRRMVIRKIRWLSRDEV